MSLAPPEQPELLVHAPAQSDPVRGRIDTATDFTRRHAAAGGVALWAASCAVLAAHCSGLALTDPVRFAMLDSWLIGLGCLGCPLLALRAMGRWLTPSSCWLIAAFCFAIALLLTVLTVTGAVHFHTLDATFAVILPEAAAIQAVNAADAERRGARRAGSAYRAGREDVLTEEVDVRCRALAGLERLAGMSVGELTELGGIIDGMLETQCADHRVLRLVAPGGRARASRVLPPVGSRRPAIRTDPA